MFYIQIDENRFQVASGNKANLVNPILVDCRSPSDCHKLKTDYEQFSGEEQWEIDPDKYCVQCKTEIVQSYNNKFTEFDRSWSAKVARGLATATEMNTARALIVTELTTALSEVE